MATPEKASASPPLDSERRRRRGTGEFVGRDHELRRNRRDKKSERQVANFLDNFTAVGMDEDKLARCKNVPAARSIIQVGRQIGAKLVAVNESVNPSLKTKFKQISDSQKGKLREYDVPTAYMIAFATIAVSLESFNTLIWNVAEGAIEAVMKVSGSVADALQESYRDKFAPTNDFQEVTMAALMFIGNIWYGISLFVSTLSSNIRTFLVDIFNERFGKEVSRCVYNACDMITSIFFIWLFFKILVFKVILFSCLLLIVVSFMLKMDDFDEPLPDATMLEASLSQSPPAEAKADVNDARSKLEEEAKKKAEEELKKKAEEEAKKAEENAANAANDLANAGATAANAKEE